ncbi:L-2-amino-thiazoline-4-carboxylic acid hydrolase [Candidatus Sumerlaeota bacterium]|nr:L-2-amino-thiazoline-4-carboxylic acid hydrolase [Candidatus Sumerlaeota bacterium]
MIELTDKQIAEFFHRSYTSVDGLWFMKVEEKYGFDVALDIDNEVWRVMPKIQARKLKSFANLDKGMEALFECLTTKLALEGFVFKTEKMPADNGFRIIISDCPWHNLLIKAKREAVSEQIGTLICQTEYEVWASEFGDDIEFVRTTQICKGDDSCILQFRQ